MRKSIGFKLHLCIGLLLFSCSTATQQDEQAKRFNIDTDLLLGHFDCKTDVDDLHAVAAFTTLLSSPNYQAVNYHAVAGTYGTQDGLYVPANSLFDLAFDKNWSDAHENFEKAIEEVKTIATGALNNGGDIWIAEAGQSDFSAALIQALQKASPTIATKERIHVVQHSNWNEEVTSEKRLAFAKAQADYVKIPDGNAADNGSPGFRSPDFESWSTAIKTPHLQAVWKLAVELANEYNGVDGRYNNEAIEAGGLDFSDVSETCWIFGIEDTRDTEAFFERFGG